MPDESCCDPRAMRVASPAQKPREGPKPPFPGTIVFPNKIVLKSRSRQTLPDLGYPYVILPIGTQAGRIYVSNGKAMDPTSAATLQATSYWREYGAYCLSGGPWWYYYDGAADIEAVQLDASGIAAMLLLGVAAQITGPSGGTAAAVADYNSSQDERLVDRLKTDAALLALDSSLAAGSRAVRLLASLASAIHNTILTTAYQGLNVNAMLFGADTGNTMQQLVNTKPTTIDGEASNTRNNLRTAALLYARDTTTGATGVSQPLEVRATEQGNVGIETGLRGLLVNTKEELAISKLVASDVSGAGVTLTIPAVASKRAKICRVMISRFTTGAAAGPFVVTSTNLSGLSWDFKGAAAADDIDRVVIEPARPIEGDATNTATTIVCPATANVKWKVEAEWYDS